MVGLTSDYTELVKEYRPQGQKQSLWESFLTGTQQTYQGLMQQAQDVVSYDISQAYANYKQQQLQLQINEQLGAGFQQQAGQQLQSAYGSAYTDIRTQEAETLGKIAKEQASAIETGEKEFSQIGSNIKTLDRYIQDYAAALGRPAPEDAYKITTQDGLTTKELTEAGQVWYSDILNATLDGKHFDEWLLSGDLTDTELAKREALIESYRSAPDLFKRSIAGLTSEFNVEEARQRVNLKRGKQQAPKVAEQLTNNIDFDWNDSVTMFSDTWFVTEKNKYVKNNLEDLKAYYVQLGLNPAYAEEDLWTVADNMKQWFNDTGTHKASTQKNQYKHYLTQVINKRLGL